ncbi:MAG: DNA translocase FtsK [Deltaproteobacteria bacterium]|jgi:S-DNA-T family DNA segregation ATPase FtsK/SpoIIIE|nr:MAG: DNA translocase FtsK [Deltaproteobacteria bacterium]
MPKRKGHLKEANKSYLLRETVSAVLFTLGVFSFLSLLFYSNKSGLDVKGAMGTIGFFISTILGKAFGICSFIIPFVMFYSAFVVFTNRTTVDLYRKAFSSLIFLFASTTILGLTFGRGELLGYTPPGGIVGTFLAMALKDKIAGTIGSYIFVTIFFALSLIIMSNLTLSQVLDGIEKASMLVANTINRGTKSLLNLIAKLPESLNELFSKPKLQLGSSEKETKELPFLKQEVSPSKTEIGFSNPQIVFREVRKSGEAKAETPSLQHTDFKLPPIELLEPKKDTGIRIDKNAIYEKARLIEEKLSNFGVSGKVTEIRPGPVITMFEYKPSPGIKINKIASLSNDLAMALSALSIRIIAPIPGKDVIGIEVPNEKRETVVLRELLESPEFLRSKSILTLALGKEISGLPFYMDLRKAPHLLIAGTTGSGKSVLLHSVITSMLFKGSPKELKFIMIDPKMLELSVYENIPHLLHPVVTNPKEASQALKWAVKEMENRYKMLSEEGVRDIESYNRKVSKVEHREEKRLPYIVIIIDELADLMMVAPHEVRESITRLSQMARAAGIHLVVATQRPSVDVVAGLIKANFPARISFLVSSRIDSRIILDTTGAEQLLGKGDMLFLQPGTSKLIRIQAAIISDEERERITEFLRNQGKPEYNEEITRIEESEESSGLEDEKDELYYEALRIIAQTRQASISMLQRKLKIGYNRAARIVEIMEKEGLIGPQESAGKPREVFINLDQIKERGKN